MSYTATYSPEDNKLRLYAGGRLDAATYEKVKAAGFRWAPKQGLFVAPMWTPERADLLEALAGEIGDEDTSLVERQEERAERFETYSEHRAQDAEQARAAVAAIADNIPLGQPILVGHHSEKRARKDAEKIENGIRRALKMWDTSKYWTDRAAGALRHAKYKERPDVRARRIKGLEAEERKQLKVTAEARSMAAAYLKLDPDNIEAARHVANFNSFYVEAAPGGSWFTAWDVLRPEEDRYRACPAWTVAQVQAKAAEVMAQREAHAARWLEHYRNRLAYERAMLAESGGTPADQTGPEKGGACRCWCSPGYGKGWSYIQKVNRVSVTVFDNWGNGGPCFRRTIPFDKLAALMSADEVNAARQRGELHEAHDGTGFYLVAEGDEPAPKDRNEEKDRAHRDFVAAAEAARAPKVEPEPVGTVEDFMAEHGAAIEYANAKSCEAAGVASASQADLFEGMRAQLKAGVQVVSAPDLFPTPVDVARRMVELADIGPRSRVLEPSGGTGRIVDAIGIATDWTFAALTVVERSPALAAGLKVKYLPQFVLVECADFLTCNGDFGTFDRIVMNPPFSGGVDLKHIAHARHMLAPGGRLVTLCANGPRQRAALEPIATSWEDLPAGTFAGTDVRAALVVIEEGAGE